MPVTDTVKVHPEKSTNMNRGKVSPVRRSSTETMQPNAAKQAASAVSTDDFKRLATMMLARKQRNLGGDSMDSTISVNAVRKDKHERHRTESEDVVFSPRLDDDADVDEDVDTVAAKMCLISTNSRFCVVWDTIIFACVAWIAIVMPLQIAFNEERDIFWNSDAVVVIDLVIDLIFWADVLISFRTSFVDYSGEEVLDGGAIAKHYLVGYFALDLISCLTGFPVNYEEVAAHLSGVDDDGAAWDAAFELAKIGKTSKLLRTARLIKVRAIEFLFIILFCSLSFGVVWFFVVVFIL